MFPSEYMALKGHCCINNNSSVFRWFCHAMLQHFWLNSQQRCMRIFSSPVCLNYIPIRIIIFSVSLQYFAYDAVINAIIYSPLQLRLEILDIVGVVVHVSVFMMAQCFCLLPVRLLRYCCSLTKNFMQYILLFVL